MTADAARRLILASTGLAKSPRSATPDRRHFRRVMDTIDLVQLDSVNVSARTHYWVFYSRLGPYDQGKLDDWLWRSGEHFEYWAHEASILPKTRYPLLEYRMRDAQPGRWVSEVLASHPGYMEAVLAEVTERGPLRVGDLEDPGGRTGPWWGYGKGKMALEWHFHAGAIGVEERVNFARLYRAIDQIIPHDLLGRFVDRDAALIALLERSARAVGVGTVTDIADYYRIKNRDAARLLPDLVRRGIVRQVEVEGWGADAFRHVEASIPRSVDITALVSPFDPLIWFRERTERVFGLRYRIEIYVPAPKRVYGYYVLPFLMDGRIVARVDLKTDRAAQVLRIKAAHLEPGMDQRAVTPRLAAYLQMTAAWLGCKSIDVESWGDLADPLRSEIG